VAGAARVIALSELIAAGGSRGPRIDTLPAHGELPSESVLAAIPQDDSAGCPLSQHDLQA